MFICIVFTFRGFFRFWEGVTGVFGSIRLISVSVRWVRSFRFVIGVIIIFKVRYVEGRGVIRGFSASKGFRWGWVGVVG